MNQVIQTPEQQQFLVKLLGYDYEIVYKSGSENLAADALSRLNEPVSSLYSFLSTVSHCDLFSKLRKEVSSDPEMSKLHDKLQKGLLNPSLYRALDGLLYFKGRIYVSPQSDLLNLLIREAHETPMGGHSGVHKTFMRLSASFYWPGMKKHVHQFVAQCAVCQTVKYPTTKLAGLLQPLPIPDRIWEDVSMDFITGLPLVGGKSVILVVVDRLSKYAHFAYLNSGYTAPQVVTVFIDTIVKLHGFPRSIVSDRDKVFLSRFWTELFTRSGTKLKFSTSYHPQTDGQTEVLNRCLEQYLRAFVGDKPRSWIKLLSWAEYWYNTTFHSALKMSPFQAVYGRPPPSLPCYTHLQPYRQQSLAQRGSNKLSKRFFVPYKILERVGPVAYRLELPESSKIHPVFHVSLLKAWVGSPPDAIPMLPELSINNQPVMLPSSILNSRIILHNGAPEKQILVQWRDRLIDESSWEPLLPLARLFPSLDLEGKVSFDGMGSDTNQMSQFPIHLKEGSKVDVSMAQGELEDEDAQVNRRDGAHLDDGKQLSNVSTRVRETPRWLKDYTR
ncbi:unnamed protein product [Rhodiola kirilowii]